MRDTVMRLLVVDHTDQRGLRVGPSDTLDPGAFGGAAATAIGPHGQSRAQGFAALKRQCDARRFHPLFCNARIVQHRDRRIVIHSLQQGAAQVAVFDHMPHWAFFDFGMVEMHEHGRRAGPRAPVGHLDLQHWLRVIRDLGPDADALH